MTIEDDITLLQRCRRSRCSAATALAHPRDRRREPLRRTAATCCSAPATPRMRGYVVQEGSFRLVARERGDQAITVGPGTLLGELALITETKRPHDRDRGRAVDGVRIPRRCS